MRPGPTGAVTVSLARGLRAAGLPLTPRLPLARVKRVRDKYEAELKELGQAERQLRGQFAELKGRLAEAEGEAARLQGLVRQKDKALAAVKAVSRQERAASWALGPSPSPATVSRRRCRPGERAAGWREERPSPGAPPGVC